MFAVEVPDHIMIAHSFRGEVFGPAQALHGATFVVRAAFLAERLDPNGIVVDIGRAHEVLKAVLGTAQLPAISTTLPQFKGINTTTEFLTKLRIRCARRGGAQPARSAATGARSAPSASRFRNRPPRAPGTRRRCGEVGRVRGAGRSCDPDRRLCLRPAHHRGACATRLERRSARSRRRLSAAERSGASGRRRAAGRAAARPADRDRRPRLRRAAGGGRDAPRPHIR